LEVDLPIFVQSLTHKLYNPAIALLGIYTKEMIILGHKKLVEECTSKL
jgi:hypothetical protein